jgi:alkylation response protein AidB-like acyl-CoA dehydrogenase
MAVPTGNVWSISGVKQYCSGAGIIDAALVTAHSPAGLLLFDMPLKVPGVTVLESPWASSAFSDTATGPVHFEGISMPHAGAIGGPGWYLERPGFWHGAMGPAACWAGGALSLIDAAVEMNRTDPHSRAQVGALMAIAWGLETVLAKAGDEIDADPSDSGRARARALKVRHLIERWCTEVLDRFGQATGPQMLAHDPFIVRQHAALALYIRQCHGARDLEALARQ